MNTFDRYLMRRFAHVYFVAFLTTFGLFVVIDAFTNIDGFQERNAGRGYLTLFARMGEYYAYQVSPFFDMAGPILIVISAMVVFAMLQKNSEVHPILSAGIPTYRLAVPLLIAAFAVDVVLAINQELVIPGIADRLQTPRGLDKATAQRVEPVYDYATGIAIYGEELYLDHQTVRRASFALPVPEIVQDLTTLRAREAVYVRGGPERPSGWLLKGVRRPLHAVPLTELGRQIVLATDRPDEVFIVSDVDVHQLHRSNMSYRFLSTAELLRRIQSPSLGLTSLRGLALHFHERLTKPLMNLLAVLIALPLVIRKGSSSLVANLAICTLVLGIVFVFAQGSLYLGRVSLISVDLAAWLPLIVSGGLCTWLAGLVQT